MGKPTICISKNKGADQLRSNCEADQRLCFCYTDSTIPILTKSKISILYPSSVTVQPGLCLTWSKPKLLVFSHTGSNIFLLLSFSWVLFTYTSLLLVSLSRDPSPYDLSCWWDVKPKIKQPYYVNRMMFYCVSPSLNN